MVKIRLRRVGATKKPMYRIVAADSHSPRDGRFLETLGHYNPLTQPATVVVKEERVQYWLSHGAQPTDVVARLLRKSAAAEAPVAVAIATEAPPAAETSDEEGAAPEKPRRATRTRRAAQE